MEAESTNDARSMRQRSSTPFPVGRRSPTIKLANTEEPESDAIHATAKPRPVKQQHAKKVQVAVKAPARRRLSSEEGTASSPPIDSSASSGIKLDLRTGKKRKPGPEKEEKDGDAENPPSAKRVKATKRRNNASHSAPTPPTIAPPQLLPAPLTPAVGHAVTAMRKFITQTYCAEDSRLCRDTSNRNHISLSTVTLVSAISRLYRYWQIGDPSEASASDVGDAIVRYFDRDYPSGVVQCVVIDGSTRTGLERRIHAKIRGHGLERVRLLEMELEMAQQELDTQLGLNWHTTEEELLGRVRAMWDAGAGGEADVVASELATTSADGDEAAIYPQLRRMLDARFYSRAGVSGAELEKLLDASAAVESSNASEETEGFLLNTGNTHMPADWLAESGRVIQYNSQQVSSTNEDRTPPPRRGPTGLPPAYTNPSGPPQHREDSVQSPEDETRPAALALDASEGRKEGCVNGDEIQLGGLPSVTSDLAEP